MFLEEASMVVTWWIVDFLPNPFVWMKCVGTKVLPLTPPSFLSQITHGKRQQKGARRKEVIIKSCGREIRLKRLKVRKRSLRN